MRLGGSPHTNQTACVAHGADTRHCRQLPLPTGCGGCGPSRTSHTHTREEPIWHDNCIQPTQVQRLVFGVGNPHHTHRMFGKAVCTSTWSRRLSRMMCYFTRNRAVCAQDTNHTKEVRLYHDNNHKTSSMTACGRMQCVSPTTCATLADHKNRREKIFKAPLTGPLLSGEALLGPAQQITHVRPPPPTATTTTHHDSTTTVQQQQSSCTAGGATTRNKELPWQRASPSSYFRPHTSARHQPKACLNVCQATA